MKRKYCKPEIEINSFIANEYVSACSKYRGDCVNPLPDGDPCSEVRYYEERPVYFTDYLLEETDTEHKGITVLGYQAGTRIHLFKISNNSYS